MKNKIKFLSLVFFVANFCFESLAFDVDISQAFASFIDIVHSNTQASNKGNALCIYGSDEISTRLNDIKTKEIVFLEQDITSKHNRYHECRVIYVGKDAQKYVKSFIDVLNKSGAVTLSHFNSFINDGGMIFIDLGRKDFELTVNYSLLKKSGARIDSSITGLIVNKK